MEKLIKKYKEYKDLISKYKYAIFVLSFDNTTDCPINDREYSSNVENFFNEKILDIELSNDYQDLIYKLHENKEKLDFITSKDIEIEYKALVKIKKIPEEMLKKHYKNLSACYLSWEKARETLDYSKFLEDEKELVDYYKEYIKLQETKNLIGFDILLDEMEEGYNEEKYDKFFDVIEKELVPFVKKILACKQKYNPILDTLKFDITKQKEITKKIASIMEYDNSVGCIRETIHPYTNWANNNDVRITTNYQEDLLFSNIYSIMHEIGHALFQLHMDSIYNDTNIFNNVTCITHESQSRFYENYLGRDRSFIKYLYPILKETYPETLKDITEDDIYYYVNACKAQYKRTEADELTYPLHVLIRYKVEKKLFHNEITVDQMEETFNYYMNKYLGITPTNLKEGCFQDSHWTASFGYFPTYAVGSAYGAMFIKAMAKDLDYKKDLEKGDFTNINKWLKDKIHKYSGTRKNDEVIRAVCNKDFDVYEYVNYLKDKFSKIYLD